MLDNAPRKKAVACAAVDMSMEGPTIPVVLITDSSGEGGEKEEEPKWTRSRVFTRMKMLSTPTARTWRGGGMWFGTKAFI